MDNKKVGELIAKLRKEKGLTQEKLGELVGVGDGAVSKWERGINTPDKGIINELSEILGISSTELLNGEINIDPLPKATEIEEIITNEESNKSDNSDDPTKKTNNLKRIIIIIIPIIIVIISAFLIFNHNKTYAYNLLSTNDEYYVEGKAIFKGNNLSVVVSKVKFKNTQFNDTIIKNYEYLAHSKDKQLFKYGYLYLTDESEGEQTIKEFSKSFIINYNSPIDIKRRYIVENNVIISFKFLDNNNNEISKDIELSLEKIKNNK